MISDLRNAVRQMSKSPAFSFNIVVILALAVSATTVLFSITSAVLLKPLPWLHGDRLVSVWNTAPFLGWPLAPVSVPDYLDRRNQTNVFADSALAAGVPINLVSDAGPQQLRGLRVTSSYFSLLGVSPWKGRSFTAEEIVAGLENMAVISFDLWKTRFGGREDVLGHDIQMNGYAVRVIGIMPKGFYSPRSPFIDAITDVWLPYVFTSEEVSEKGRGNWLSTMIATLRPGKTIAEAQQQIDAVQQHNAQRWHNSGPDRKTGVFGLVTGYREQTTEGIRPALLILDAAVALVLLIACANVANLLLVRATTRKREIAIRLALGCGRLRLAWQFFMECLVLSIVGGAAGVWLASWGLDLFHLLGGDSLPNSQAIGIDASVLAFSLIVTISTSVFVSLIPIASVWRENVGEALSSGNSRGTTVGRSTNRARALLIVAEVGVALVLLIPAGLTIKSFLKLGEVRPGFSSDQVLTARINLPNATHNGDAAVSGFFADALSRIRSFPGVKQASAVSFLPFAGDSVTSDYEIKGLAHQMDGPGWNAQIECIDPAYFLTMQIPLLRGRMLSDADTAMAKPVVVIDQFLAHRWFGDHDPIGQEIRSYFVKGAPWFTIVGVVGEIKNKSMAEPVTKETIYFSIAQVPASAMTFVLKTAVDPQTLVVPLRAAIRELDSQLPIFDIQTMDHRVAGSMTSYRSPMIVLLVFGGTALILASLGLYGVLAYSVGQRSREIGIRIALGAEPRAIIGLVVGQGMKMTSVGLALGLGAAFAVNRLLETILFGVGTTDPLTYLSVSGLLLAVAFVACYMPARRATKVDPVVALRAE